MVVDVAGADLLLGDVHSLKEKRVGVRPIVAELRRRFEVAVAETGDAGSAPAGRGVGCAGRSRQSMGTYRRCSKPANGCSRAVLRSSCCRPGSECSTTTISTELVAEEIVMADAGRARRLAGRIKQIVATQIESHIKDPRLGMVTLTDVRVSGDLHDATIFYTVFGTDEQRAPRPAIRRWSRPRACSAARSVARPACGSPRPSRSSSTRCPTTCGTSTSCWPWRPSADAEVEAARQGAQAGRRRRSVPEAARRRRTSPTSDAGEAPRPRPGHRSVCPATESGADPPSSATGATPLGTRADRRRQERQHSVSAPPWSTVVVIALVAVGGAIRLRYIADHPPRRARPASSLAAAPTFGASLPIAAPSGASALGHVG